MRGKTQLRIATGKFGGRIINSPRNHGTTQPMGGRERLAIFNRIRNSLKDAAVLDAFAGSGALGLTALSENAKSADFLDNDAKAQKTINENIAKLGLQQQARVIKRLTAQYDVIFADPPYDKPQYAKIEKLIDHLRPGGWLILSHPGTPEPPAFLGLAMVSNRSYASAHIKIYQKI